MRKHIFVAVLLLIGALALLAAYVTWPSKTYYQHVEEPAEANGKAESGQTGTDKSPFVIRIRPSQDDKSKTDAERADKHEKAVYDHMLTTATIVLAIFTLALACFTAYLWVSTSELVRDA